MQRTRSSVDSVAEQPLLAGRRSARFVVGLFVLSSGCARGEALDDAAASHGDTSDASTGRIGGTGGAGGQAFGGAVASGGAAASGGAMASGGIRSTPPEASGGVGSSAGGMHAGGAGSGGFAGAGGANRAGAGGDLTAGTAGTLGSGGTLTGGASNAGGKGGGVAAGGSTVLGTGGGAGAGGAGSVCQNYPTNDACSRCICANCAPQVSSCYDSSDSSKNSGCAQIESCAEANHCASSPCYCGTAALCIGANGACKAVIETVDGTTDALTINNDGNDTSRALGRANAIGLCSTKACKSECNLP